MDDMTRTNTWANVVWQIITGARKHEKRWRVRCSVHTTTSCAFIELPWVSSAGLTHDVRVPTMTRRLRALLFQAVVTRMMLLFSRRTGAFRDSSLWRTPFPIFAVTSRWSTSSGKRTRSIMFAFCVALAHQLVFGTARVSFGAVSFNQPQITIPLFSVFSFASLITFSPDWSSTRGPVFLVQVLLNHVLQASAAFWFILFALYLDCTGQRWSAIFLNIAASVRTYVFQNVLVGRRENFAPFGIKSSPSSPPRVTFMRAQKSRKIHEYLQYKSVLFHPFLTLNSLVAQHCHNVGADQLCCNRGRGTVHIRLLRLHWVSTDKSPDLPKEGQPLAPHECWGLATDPPGSVPRAVIPKDWPR